MTEAESPNITYSKLLSVSLVSRVDLLDVILRVFNDNLMRVAIKLEDDRDEVLLAVFNPPTCELQILDLIYKRTNYQT